LRRRRFAMLSKDEKAERDEQRRQYNEKKEMAELRTVFDTLDKDHNNKIDFKELNEMLIKLDYKAKRQEVEDMIWEVDENGDKAVDWEEFKLMFQRCKADKTGYEPRQLFNVVEFMMHDKDGGGTIDMDECMEILFRRFGKEQLEERTNAFFKQAEGSTEITFTEFVTQMSGKKKRSKDEKSTTSSTGGRRR